MLASAPDGAGSEFGTNYAVISLARNGQVNNSLPVNFTVSGTAVRGQDYQIYQDGFEVTGTSINIGAEHASAELEIRPIHDSTPEPGETVIITITNGSAYVVGGTNAATVTIGDAGPEVAQSSHLWQTAPNQLVIDIDRALESTVEAGDFVVVNLDTNQPVNPQAFATQDLGTAVRATLTFNGVLPDGHYRVTAAAGAFANSLGDLSFAPLAFDFFQLAGDADHDGTVALADFNTLAGNFGLTSGQNASTGDFDYDLDVDLDDFNILATKYGTGLPPLRAAALTSSAITATRFNDAKRVEDDPMLSELK
jgi:hypothetical protein